MSIIESDYCIFKAMEKSEKEFEITEWKGRDEIQKKFLKRFSAAQKQKKETRNRLRITHCVENPKIIASTIYCRFLWNKKANLDIISIPGKYKPCLGAQITDVSFLQDTGWIIGKMKSISSDHIFVAVTDHTMRPEEEFQMSESLQMILEKASPVSEHKYERLIFPVCHVAHERSLGWLLDLKARTKKGNKMRIKAAFQKNILSMGRAGIKLPDKFERLKITDLAIRKPFYLWVKLDYFGEIFFSAYISKEDWINYEKENNFLSHVVLAYE